MKISVEESLIEENKDYQLYTGQFVSKSTKESIYYKKARPVARSTEAIYHLIIVHDLFEYHQRHLGFLKFMKSKYEGQLEITWIDLKGHGLSSGTRSHISKFEELTLNLVKLINLENLVDEEVSYRKTILFGQGLGGMIILDLLMNDIAKLDRKLDGVIFSNPDFFISHKFPSWAYKLLDYAGSFMGSIRVPSPLSGEDLNDQQEQIDSYNADPLINHFCSLSLINQMMAKAKMVRGFSYFLDHPSLFLLSDKDVWGDSDKTKIFSKGMPKDLKTLTIYKNTKRELTNSEVSDKVFYDIFSWLKKLK